MPDKTLKRRKFLYGTGSVGIAGIAGCLGDDDDDGDDGDSDGTGDDSDDGDDGDSDDGSQDLSLRVGTSTGGTRDVGLAVERAVSQESDTLDYSTIESPGYIGSLRRMANEQFNAGIVDNNSLTKANEGNGEFDEEPVDSVPQYGFFAFPYSIFIVARDGTGIETFDDLAGASLYPAEPGFSTRGTTLDVLSQDPTADIYDQMDIQDQGVDSAPGALEEGSIDASIAYGTAGVRYTGWVQEFASRVDVHYVEPTDALQESAESFAGAGTSTTSLDEWSFPNQDIGTDEVFTWDLEVNYTFTPAASNDAVYELCRVVNEHNDTVNEGEEQFNDFESAEDMHASAPESIPVHAGAVQYYQDNDAWDDSLQEG